MNCRFAQTQERSQSGFAALAPAAASWCGRQTGAHGAILQAFRDVIDFFDQDLPIRDR
jgi:hypothetical protein